MNRSCYKGHTLLELIVAIAIFSIVGSLGVTLLTLCQQYFVTGAAQTDIVSSAQVALPKLVLEMQESDMAGVAINNTHDAILLISARDSIGQFQIYSTGISQYFGQPNWQKWVCYYLIPQPGTSYSELIRKEGNPLGSTFPNPSVPAPPAGWENSFRNAYNIPAHVVARDVQTLDIEDITCTATGNPMYVQVISSQQYGGKLSSYNPGWTVSFSCGKTGNWVQAQVKN